MEKKDPNLEAKRIKRELVRKERSQMLNLLDGIKQITGRMLATAQILSSTLSARRWPDRLKPHERNLLASLISDLSVFQSAFYPPHPCTKAEGRTSPQLREALHREGVKISEMWAVGEMIEEFYSLDIPQDSEEEGTP